LLQIFTETVIGPIFFEIIQRKGNDGFGGAISAPSSNRSSATRSAAVSSPRQ
jgi:4-hydroxyphenylpyruvate dioxygenase-like putative hemolysin